MISLGILGSTRGTHLLTINEAIQQKRLSANLNVVISNKNDALILERARHLNIPAQFVDPKNTQREEFDRKVTTLLQTHQVDLIVLVGYMRILSEEFVTAWQHKVINVHPSLLPAYAGKMDLDVHRAVLNANETESGCTVHYVTKEVDAGPIIIQKKCPVFAHDTPELLKERVQTLEGAALIEAINKLFTLSS